MNRYILELHEISNQQIAGTKAYNLHRLQKWGFRVPATLVCTSNAFQNHISNLPSVQESIRHELQGLIDENISYAVRSSTTLEDGAKYSFAGQFTTFLNVSSLEEIVAGIQKVWESGNTKNLQCYIERAAVNILEVQTGVIIQEMVKAQISGVVFTCNPLTGFDETVVELLEGEGASLVQRGVTPWRGVYKWGKWLEYHEMQSASLEVLNLIVKEAQEITKKYGRPVDLEWAYNGQDLYWLQLRGITALSKINIYSNKMSKEMLPGMIKPLVWSINIPVVVSSKKRLLCELAGKAAEGIDIELLAKSIYYRTYFNMGIFGDIFALLGMPRETLEIMMGVHERSAAPKFKMKPGRKTLKYLPRLLLFLLTHATFRSQTERYYRRQKPLLEKLQQTRLEEFSENQILQSIQSLIVVCQEISHYTILTQLLAAMHCYVLRHYLRANRIDPSMVAISSDPAGTQDVSAQYGILQLGREWAALEENEKQQIETAGWDCWLLSSGSGSFRNHLLELLHKFGHYSESTVDLSRKTWRENISLVAKLIKEAGGRTNLEDQSKYRSVEGLKMTGLKKLIFNYLYKGTIRALNTREKITYLYNYGYGLFRPRFQRLAKLLVKEGNITSEDDIFYLSFSEIREAFKNEVRAGLIFPQAEKRKMEMAFYSDIDLPEIVIGDALPTVKQGKSIANVIQGMPVSGGYIEGVVRLIRSMDDFPKMKDNDIILIPFSDIGWTPVLTRAKAIISESGGFLSHCAIVAREFGIPAVVAAKQTGQIHDEDRVAVNGYTGEVIILSRCHSEAANN